MEKYSTWRDAGTGIQPFLTPLPPVQQTSLLMTLWKPIGYIVGAARLVLLLVPLILYGLGHAFSLILLPIPPLRRLVVRLSTGGVLRLALLMLGFFWIPVEVVTRKKGRGAMIPETWKPLAGDVIVCNWTSWLEVLYLAFRWNPVFVLPVALGPSPSAPSTPRAGTPVTPGRRTGTGSAAISSPTPTAARTRSPILGFQETSLFGILSRTGLGPLAPNALKAGERAQSLEEIRKRADRPVVVFPECTTSNGRALLGFADIFEGVAIPVRQFQLFVMCVRYDPPTPGAPTLTHSIPAGVPFVFPNPLPHIFRLLAAPALSRSMSVRLLAPSDSPSCGSFVASDFFVPGAKDQLGEACSQLILQLGKLKRTTVLGWEEKESFLTFYQSKTS